MNSIRKWLYKPKKSDTSLLAQFYFVDEDLNQVASELDSFDGRKDPERCTMLVNQLRVCQDKVLTVIQKIMDDAIPKHRANRDFRVKFPDDVLQDSLSGQLWFGAECLAAGSSILNREVESASMRPLARALTKNLDSLRNVLREQCLKTVNEYTERIREALIIFDKLFAEFELSYVSAMVPVKTMKEYDMLQEVTVLFSETVQRALKVGLLTQDMLDDYDPALMFTIPRLAIVCGLLVHPEGPLNPDMDPTNITEMFRPFQTLLFKIRELLYTLNTEEFSTLEKSLCSSEEPDVSKTKPVGTDLELGLENLQIDQGFDEEGEGIVAMDLISSNILMLAPSSQSPVTPVNIDGELSELDAVSPSSTIIEDGFRFSTSSGLNLMDEGLPALNKSESQDSGLHSENISTSDTVTVDVIPGQEGASSSTEVQSISRNLKKSPDSNRKLVQSKTIESIVETVSECDGVDSNTLCDSPVCGEDSDVNRHTADLSSVSTCQSEAGSDVKHLCQDLVNEIVENALKLHSGAIGNSCDTEVLENQLGETTKDATLETENNCNDSNADTNSVESRGAMSLSRQFSWQYNIQLASQNYTLLETGRSERSVDGGSISSDSTISDQGAHDSVSEFVIETLSNMTQAAESGDSVIGNTATLNSKCLADGSDSGVNPNISNNSNKELLKTDQNSANDQSVACKPDSHVSSKTNTNGLEEGSSQSAKSHLTNKTLKQKNLRKVKKDRRESLEHINCKTGPQPSTSIDPLDLPALRALRDEDSWSYSSSQSTSSECDCDKECTCAESETSSCNSENNDKEEIALAIKAAELASRNEARSKFRSSSDLIHRLFVCIAGVADQLQTNYAGDLRHILKCVFELNSTNSDEPEIAPEPTITPCVDSIDNTEIENVSNDGSSLTSSNSDGISNDNQQGQRSISDGSGYNNQQGQRSISQEIISEPISRQPSSPRRIFDEPPEWEPDALVERCTSCKTPFTFVRRRHHCRNCGKIFCGKCSSTTVPLPQYGHQMPVRVCHKCFLYQIAHFTMQ